MEDIAPKNFVPVPFEYHQEIELTIVDVTNTGLGIGRCNNWVIMVPFVCIGEIVVTRIYKNCKNYSLADLVEVKQKSPDRIDPQCPLFSQCGGCQYQHMTYESQLLLKQHHVEDIMLRIGGIKTNINPCLHGNMPYGYRSKITPHYQKKAPPIGFLKDGKRQIIDVVNCPLATKNINKSLNDIRNKIIDNSSQRKRGGTMLIRDIDGEIVTDHKAYVTTEVCGYKFSFCAGEFFQNNPYTLPHMIDFVIKSANGTLYLIDAYCGVGVFGICSARNFKEVIGIEISETSVKFANHNATQNNISNAKFISGIAENIFQNINFPGNYTSVIIDPPRAGCSESFIYQLLSFSPKKIIYISCAPDTQARDIKLLSKKYKITEMQPVDMFPQTRHIENIAVLEKI